MNVVEYEYGDEWADEDDAYEGGFSKEELQQMGVLDEKGRLSGAVYDPSSTKVRRPRPPVLSPEAIRLVTEQLASERGYELNNLISAVRRGRPTAEQRTRLDTLGEIVKHLRTTRAGANSRLIPDRHSPQPVAALEAIGKALGLAKDAVLRLERRGVNQT